MTSAVNDLCRRMLAQSADCESWPFLNTLRMPKKTVVSACSLRCMPVHSGGYCWSIQQDAVTTEVIELARTCYCAEVFRTWTVAGRLAQEGAIFDPNNHDKYWYAEAWHLDLCLVCLRAPTWDRVDEWGSYCCSNVSCRATIRQFVALSCGLWALRRYLPGDIIGHIQRAAAHVCALQADRAISSTSCS